LYCISRPQDWKLLVNGVQKASGFLNGCVSRSQAETFNVSSPLKGGDTVDLQVYEDTTAPFGFFVGTTMNISATNPTATTLASSLNPSVFGQNVTLTATVTSNAGTPTGTVQFNDGQASLGTATLNGGVASVSVSTLAVGSHAISAVYQPDSGNFAGSASAVLAQSVTNASFTISANPTSATLRAGQSGLFAISVNPVGQFSGTIGFSCSGLPSLAQCQFNPSTVTLNGTTALTMNLTLTTAGSNTGSVGMLKPGTNGTHYARSLGLSTIALPGIVVLGIGLRRKKLVASFVITFVIIGLVSCGGNGGGTTITPTSQPTTPAGSYPVVVTATSTGASGAISTQVTLNIAVTQ
jgi:hypothetical protein